MMRRRALARDASALMSSNSRLRGSELEMMRREKEEEKRDRNSS